VGSWVTSLYRGQLQMLEASSLHTGTLRYQANVVYVINV